jgi:hypothetical protein
MSRPTTEFDPTQFHFTVRFDQGYRYLDRCGEAVIKLENTLDPGWVPGEFTPASGNLRNYTLGLAAFFNTTSLSVVQAEFLSFEHFLDQTCKIYDVVRGTFEIKRILTPVLRVVAQVGFSDEAGAEEYLLGLRLCSLDAALVRELGGAEAAVNLTVCTELTEDWQGSPAKTRRRMEVKVVKQERQPLFDERLMLRLPLVSSRYHEAIAEHRRLRRQHPAIVDVAIQFDLENSIESELNGAMFDVAGFLRISHDWTESARAFMKRRIQNPCQST